MLLSNPNSQNFLFKSIQEGVITIPAGSTSAAITLAAAVDKSKSIPGFLGFYTSTSNRDEINPRVELTDDNTATAYVHSASTSGKARNVRYQIREFYPWAIRHIEHGTITVSASASNTLTPGFTPDDPDNCFCIFLGCTTDATGDSNRISTSHIDVSHDAVNNILTGAYASSQSTSTTAGYCLVEFNPGVIKSRQEITLSITSGNSSNTGSISSVDLDNTLTFLGGYNYTDGFTTEEIMGYLSSGTQAAAERVSTASSTSKIRLLLAELETRWLKQVQRGQTTMSAGTATTDAAITASASGKTLLSYLGHKAENSFANTEYTFPSVGDQSTTAIRVQRDTSTDFGLVPTASWEAAEAY